MGDIIASLNEAAIACQAPHAATAVVQDCGERVLPSGDAQSDDSSVRWLDWLIAFERMGDGACAPVGRLPSLPEMRPLRAACLRSRCTAEELRERIQRASKSEDIQACFSDLGLDGANVDAWVEAWRHLGTRGLLAKLPLTEAAMPQAVQDAWLRRCAFAIQKEQADLKSNFDDALKSSAGGQSLSETEFAECCRFVLTAEISRDDAEDLALMSVGPDGQVDSASFL